MLSPAQCLHFHREQAALIEVYFEQLNYESLRESEAYGVSWLSSDRERREMLNSKSVP